MKVYTKSGDGGKTSLYGGRKLNKSHVKIASYGEVDELNSWVGCIATYSELLSEKEFLIQIQNNLFNIGSHLASDQERKGLKKPEFKEEFIFDLENKIDRYEETLSPMKYFVLPGGSQLVSFIHIARTVCRRAERSIVALHEEEPQPEFILKYINRLSDFIFVLSRKITQDSNVEETPWKPHKI